MKNRKIHSPLINVSTNFKPRLKELKALKSSTQRSVFMDVYRRRQIVSWTSCVIMYFINIGKCRTVRSRSILSYCIDYTSNYPDTIRSWSRIAARRRMINICNDIMTLINRSNS